jgi:hypothetical protein
MSVWYKRFIYFVFAIKIAFICIAVYLRHLISKSPDAAKTTNYKSALSLKNNLETAFETLIIFILLLNFFPFPGPKQKVTGEPTGIRIDQETGLLLFAYGIIMLIDFVQNKFLNKS